MSVLDKIVATTRRDLEHRRAATPLAALESRLAAAPPVRDFERALRRPGRVSLIAEVKRASPSQGLIREDFDPVAIAAAYREAGAACVSVLTDEPFFQGCLEYLRRIRESVPDIPLLRKDFIVDPYQVVEARCAGADALLLIAECLDDKQLPELLALTRRLGMAALVECYDEPNVPRVVAAGATLIGVNNRDLRTFVTDLGRSLTLRAHVPADRLFVAESGIRGPADVARLRAAGVDAMLVGEHLMRQPDVGRAVRELLAEDAPSE